MYECMHVAALQHTQTHELRRLQHTHTHTHTFPSMDPKTSTLATALILLLLCTVSQTNANHQIKALSHLQKRKLIAPESIDSSHFNGARDVFSVKIHRQHGLKERDLIKRLPGQPSTKVHFRQYGGYVTVDKASTRAFYYYFVEGQSPKKKPQELPLVLWLNGGPGCSSLAYGAMQEIGPFRVHSDGKTLYRNKHAWNYAANVLFLESPAGVGFSYSNVTADNQSGGDRKTAEDNYAFLLNWLERFPEYKEREFYIAGESYGGHYVPQLAHLIQHYNAKARKSIINLKGILIGNAVINDETDERGMYEYFGSHALASDETTAQVMKYCDFTKLDSTAPQSSQCNNAVNDAESNLNNIDIYNIYAPNCKSSDLTAKPKDVVGDVIDPCSDFYDIAYFNRPEVQSAMHANVTKIPYSWQPCSDVLLNWTDSASTVIPLLKGLMSKGIRVWIFSGDIDARVPVTSTLQSIKRMNLRINVKWHPWYYAGEVGGFTQVYEGDGALGDLTFATVRGAGHQVPSFQPGRALSLIMHFLDGTELPA